jgi:hypothetical protein
VVVREVRGVLANVHVRQAEADTMQEHVCRPACSDRPNHPLQGWIQQ